MEREDIVASKWHQWNGLKVQNREGTYERKLQARRNQEKIRNKSANSSIKEK